MSEQPQGWQLPNRRGVWHFWQKGADKSACGRWWGDDEAWTTPMPPGRMCKQCAWAARKIDNAPLP